MPTPTTLTDTTIDSVVSAIRRTPLSDETKSAVEARITESDFRRILPSYLDSLHATPPERHDSWAYNFSGRIMDYIGPILSEDDVPTRAGRGVHQCIYHALGGQKPLR